MAGNLIIIHGGGPTAVINASLYGAIRQAQASPQVDRVLVAIGGTGGFLKEQIKDVTDLSEQQLSGLLTSPASAIGTSRDALEQPEYELNDMKRAFVTKLRVLFSDEPFHHKDRNGEDEKGHHSDQDQN